MPFQAVNRPFAIKCNLNSSLFTIHYSLNCKYMITADQLKDIQDRADALYRYLDIEKKKVEFEEEDLRTQAPDFWEDPERAQEQMKLVKDIKKWLDGYEEVRTATDELALAMEFYRDEMVTEEEVDADYERALKAIEDLELRNMLRQKEDPMACVLKINSGAGGTEAQDWASMLWRMYMRWAETHGYKVTISDLEEADEAGIKSVTMEIEGGEYAYGYLKSDSSLHLSTTPSRFMLILPALAGIPSVQAVPVVRTSTRLRLVYVSDICTKTRTQARKRKSSLPIPRAVSSSRTEKTLCDCSSHSSTIVL